MKLLHLLSVIFFFNVFVNFAQENSNNTIEKIQFHKNRRDALRAKLPSNSVAVFFSNPVRNRSNDVNYYYHQNPNFYYLTGYTEPHAVLLIFKNEQTAYNQTFNEIIFVQERNKQEEMWNGKRLGVDGVQNNLGFTVVLPGRAFKNFEIDFSKFDKILFNPFKNDVRNTTNKADLFNLIQQFKKHVNYDIKVGNSVFGDRIPNKNNEKIDTKSLKTHMASLREIKTPYEIKKLKKAIEISAIAQVELMKALHEDMSELEVQAIHEFVYKKYGAAHVGYPSIVGAGANGCILHYIDNNKAQIGKNKMILMDLGAEYQGYTADVTRTVPASGYFTNEQKLIYNVVYKAQEAGIKAAKVRAKFWKLNEVTKKIINEGLYQLGIIKSPNANHNYYPHGASHHIGLDVHDASNFGSLKENMVITVEPGIYIPEGSNCDKKWWGIAVRIEDDILITKKGPIILSKTAPRTAEEIEAVMKKPSALTNFNLPELD